MGEETIKFQQEIKIILVLQVRYLTCRVEDSSCLRSVVIIFQIRGKDLWKFAKKSEFFLIECVWKSETRFFFALHVALAISGRRGKKKKLQENPAEKNIFPSHWDHQFFFVWIVWREQKRKKEREKKGEEEKKKAWKEVVGTRGKRRDEKGDSWNGRATTRDEIFWNADILMRYSQTLLSLLLTPKHYISGCPYFPKPP